MCKYITLCVGLAGVMMRWVWGPIRRDSAPLPQNSLQPFITDYKCLYGFNKKIKIKGNYNLRALFLICWLN